MKETAKREMHKLHAHIVDRSQHAHGRALVAAMASELGVMIATLDHDDLDCALRRAFTLLDTMARAHATKIRGGHVQH